MIGTVLLVVAFILLVIAAFKVELPIVSVGWLGLAFWTLSILLSGSHIVIR